MVGYNTGTVQERKIALKGWSTRKVEMAQVRKRLARILKRERLYQSGIPVAGKTSPFFGSLNYFLFFNLKLT